ncbi:MAG TPA: PQQ-binding-like beta-propeller repeat protein [Longimicrobium sp.]|nr:PQQ-binding-like beta-propeller repeat protein [Longimicrobium sp.]
MSNGDPSQGWWMYQGGPAHGGYVADTPINATNVAQLGTSPLHSLQLGGPVLSVPAAVDGYAYVGVANSVAQPGNNGGGLFKVNLATGAVEKQFTWPIDPAQRDTHGFTGMGCTPAVANGNVYFSAFDGYFYCVDQANLELVWKTNLREADLAQNQPVTNDVPAADNPNIPAGTAPENYPYYAPPAAGWSSPVVVGNSVYVGMGEGENPLLFGFVYALAADTGKVQWIFCTDQLVPEMDNCPNHIPAAAVAPGQQTPLMFTVVPGTGQPRGASVWSSIACDGGMLYVTTGNPVDDNPEDNGLDHGLPVPSPGWKDPHLPPGCTQPQGVTSIPKYAYSVLILDAASGALKAHFTPTQDTSYRPSDGDIDFGGSAAVFTQNDRRVVAAASKNGSIFLLDAGDLSLIRWRQMLPYSQDGQRIPTVDPHPRDMQHNQPPTPSNCESDNTWSENYSGTFGAPAVDPVNGLIFVGLGGPNYHGAGPGLDRQSTPFMRALRWDTLEDAWPMEPHTYTPGNNLAPVTVMRYTAAGAGAAMYQNTGEGCIGSPAIANDVVIVGTQYLGLYGFSATTGQVLWQPRRLGQQTGGLSGGYGYCMGAAIWDRYVVAGALAQGRDGGVLNIYALPQPVGGSGPGTGAGGGA